MTIKYLALLDSLRIKIIGLAWEHNDNDISWAK